MWSYFSHDTGSFTKPDNMEISDIEGKNGMELVISINVFSNWMMGKPEP